MWFKIQLLLKIYFFVDVNSIDELTDENVFNLSQKITNISDLRNLAVALGIEQSVVNSQLTNYRNDINESAHRVLSTWLKDQSKKDCPHQKLCDALKYAKMKNLIEVLK